ncbi:lysine transporter LysE [Burkholderia sp. Bp8963]|uniref:LysE/ArgO family amino acid transporter n=1 Tax=Burkholderia sp. Bp8963 TaxID=2184547 RepID=UPI000F58FF94|nr:LysE family transporter [Burkholderia sp. Bp8963]RQS76811.1 lysine transporter LysE [Burkholderia sp. Bp8963]
MLDTSALVEGLLLGAALFTSVGPKDTFVIKRSLSSAYPLFIAAICAGSDALLIAIGSLGLAAVLSHTPRIVSAALLAGIVYLACLGLLALRSAIRRTHPDAIHAGAAEPFARMALATAAVSLLNPYAWVDTVLVLGSIIASRPAGARLSIALGAVAASFIWFLSLTWAARRCRPLFAHAAAWRLLDGFVAALMISTAIHLATTRL